jgi:hypothetical protein
MMDTETVFKIPDTNSTLTWLIAQDIIEKIIYLILFWVSFLLSLLCTSTIAHFESVYRCEVLQIQREGVKLKTRIQQVRLSGRNITKS